MNVLRLIARGLAYHRRMHMAVAAGTLLACAVLTGALVVGDSVNQTMHDIAVARLGRVAHALDWGNRFFAQDLADSLQREVPRVHAATVLSLRGIAALPPGTSTPHDQLNQAHVLGVDAEFWRFAQDTPPLTALGPQEAAVNEATAHALGIKVGDDLELRVVKSGTMPQDAPLAGREGDNAVALLVTVKSVLPDRQLGRFSLAANQAAPYNVFLDRTWIQERMDLAGRANLLLADDGVDATALDDALARAWTFGQIGIEFRSHPPGILQLESSRIFVEDEIVRAALETPRAQPTLTYLVNAISREERSTPYSFVEAGPAASDMPDDAVVINQWLSDAVGANAGDRIDIAYFQLEPNNAFVEKHRAFTVFRVVPMEDFAIERALAPRFPGLSNVENCRDWDIGMPLDKDRLTDTANEAYWKAFGQTPKLMTTFKAGKEMWGTRFGSVMGIRFPVDKGGEAELEKTLRARIDAEKIGLAFAPVRKRALDGVNQAMDFGGLMAGMSAFLIGAALLLLGLLYAHGLQQRASEIGVLIAVGYPLRRIWTIFLAEAFPTALAGTVLGAIVGAAYARFLLAALAWFWPDAVASTAIAFHVRAATLAEGGAIALACTLTIILIGTWRGARRPVRELLAADYATMPTIGARRRGWGTLFFASVSLACAIAIVAAAALGAVEDLLGAFFSEGFLLLMAGLGYYAWFLGYLARHATFKNPRLWKFAVTNLARRRGRSLGVAAATACGCFLVLSVSAMRENLALHAARRDSGTGGFAIYAETTIPVVDGGAAFMRGHAGRIVPVRVRNGDDAGCLNLNHAQTPRLIGVEPAALGKLGAFAGQDFWAQLDTPLPDGRIPTFVGDTNTAMWGLKMKIGDELPYPDEAGQTAMLKLVASLPMRLSVFQGALIVSESVFTSRFPSEGGYRAFLIETPNEKARETILRLNREYGKLGMYAVTAVDRLQSFYAVESAYLAMFLVLGGLGLMLGGGGAGVVVLRNLYERRTEIALLYALGYENAIVYRILLFEHAVLATVGTLIGALAAAAAMSPLVLASQTQVSLAAQASVLGFILLIYAAAVFAALRIGLRNVSCAALRAE